MKTKYFTLKYLRERTGNKQEDFAKLLGISSGQYSKKENGMQKWFLIECEILRNYINTWLKNKGEKEMSIDDIFFGEQVSNMTQKGA